MNLFKMGKYVKPIYVLIAFLLSGCSLLPEEIAQSAINNADEYSDIKELSAYKKDVEELLAMRSSINRLVELEQDFTFLLDEMSRFEEQNPNLVFAQRPADGGEPREQNEVVYFPNGSTNSRGKGGDQTPKFDEPNDLESLGLAISQGQEQTALRKNRFSGQGAIMSTQNMTEVETNPAKKFSSDLVGKEPQQVNANKFSSPPSSSFQQSKSIVGPLPVNKNVNCGDITTNALNTFAVHLASYGSQKSAISAWKQIMSEYDSELCSNIAKTHTVQVKGKTYHRLYVGGYAEKRVAQTVCTKLQKRSTYCKVVEFEGDML